MNEATLQAFRDLAAAMQTESADWQWIGPHMSQRMFGITRTRAEGYAARHGGTAQPMNAPTDYIGSVEVADGYNGARAVLYLVRESSGQVLAVSVTGWFKVDAQQLAYWGA